MKPLYNRCFTINFRGAAIAPAGNYSLTGEINRPNKRFIIKSIFIDVGINDNAAGYQLELSSAKILWQMAIATSGANPVTDLYDNLSGGLINYNGNGIVLYNAPQQLLINSWAINNKLQWGFNFTNGDPGITMNVNCSMMIEAEEYDLQTF